MLYKIRINQLRLIIKAPILIEIARLDRLSTLFLASLTHGLWAHRRLRRKLCDSKWTRNWILLTACWTSSNYVESDTLIRSCRVPIQRMTLQMLDLAREGHGVHQRAALASRAPIFLRAQDLLGCPKPTLKCSVQVKNHQSSCIMKHQKLNFNLRANSMSKMQCVSATEGIL